MKAWVGGLTMMAVLSVGGPAPVEAAEPTVGEMAPEFALESLDGEAVRLSDSRGKIVVLHFGAGW